MLAGSICDMKYRSVKIITAKVPWETIMGSASLSNSTVVLRLKWRRIDIMVPTA